MAPIDLQAETLPRDVFLTECADPSASQRQHDLVADKPYTGGCETEMNGNIADDRQLMGLLEDRYAIEAIEYGDPESRQGGLQSLAIKAMRELGLPACLGKFIDLENDRIVRRAIKSELTRRDALGQLDSYAHQDLNAWDTSLQKIEPLVRMQLTPEDAAQLDHEMSVWSEEMEHKAARVASGLQRLRR